MNCPLCQSQKVNSIMADYFLCEICDLRFLTPKRHLTKEQEQARYMLHQNLDSDPDYIRFFTPLVEAITSMNPLGSVGLDFGSGPSPVLARFLRNLGYKILCYDPFFNPDTEPLNEVYDFAYACEVIEHFYSPAQEFTCLKRLLKPGGTLALMTHIYSDEINFDTWYYRKDPTHVVFYSTKTFSWICKTFSFKDLRIHSHRVVTLKN